MSESSRIASNPQHIRSRRSFASSNLRFITKFIIQHHHEITQHLQQHQSVSDLFDYAIVDQNQESLGTLHSMWTNHDSGQLEFLGVKTGWLFGSNHVVPAGKAQIDEATRTIQVPYTLALIKDAPSIDADAEISDAQEAEIFRYYGGARGTTTAASTRTTETTAGTAAALTTGAATAAGRDHGQGSRGPSDESWRRHRGGAQ